MMMAMTPDWCNDDELRISKCCAVEGTERWGRRGLLWQLGERDACVLEKVCCGRLPSTREQTNNKIVRDCGEGCAPQLAEDLLLHPTLLHIFNSSTPTCRILL